METREQHDLSFGSSDNSELIAIGVEAAMRWVCIVGGNRRVRSASIVQRMKDRISSATTFSAAVQQWMKRRRR